MKSGRHWSMLPVLFIFLTVVATLRVSAQIQVNSTNPPNAPQGTVNFNVTINGDGYKQGAKAQWFVTGTTNPGGVTVNSTTFTSSTQLTANITISNDAVTGGYDIVVTNSDGRTGKGTDLFTVNPMAVSSTLYSSDTTGLAVTVHGDDSSGVSLYGNTPESCSLDKNSNCIIMDLLPNDWYLRISGSTSIRTIYVKFLALNGPDESALDGYYLGAAVTTRCFDANNNRMDIGIAIPPGTAYNRCSLRVNFTANGIGYAFVMGPTYSGTGWSTVACTSGTQVCNGWTISPTPGNVGPNPTVGDLYSFTKHSSTVIGTYFMSFNIALVRP